MYFFVLLNGPHLSKLVKLIVSRKRCLGAWRGRSCGILSKLLDKPCTAQLPAHYGIYIDFSSTKFQSHQNCMWDRWSLLQPWQVRFLGKQLKHIPKPLKHISIDGFYSSLVVPSRHLGISREHWWQKNLCSTSAILVLVPVLALPMDWNWTPALSAGYISGKTTLENMAYSNIMRSPTCYYKRGYL